MTNLNNKTNTKRINLITTLLFTLYIGVFFILQIILPSSSFSEYENRNLKASPEFNSNDFFSGEFTKDLDTYITDQFPYRNFWVSLKSSSEWALGKSENGLVYLGKDSTLLDKFPTIHYDTIDNNLKRIAQFSASVDLRVNFTLIPSQSAIYDHLLDTHTPVDNQRQLLNYISTQIEDDVTYIDLMTPLYARNDEYIYYYSDHHWTSLGAYYAYVALAETLSYEAISLDTYTPTLVSNEFQGTTHSKSPIPWFRKDSIFSYTPNQTITVDSGNGFEEAPLYDESKLDQKNQYEYFLGGNPPLAVVSGTGSGTLLLIRDSYSNALVPFLTAHYESIHMIDLRTCRYSISEYILKHNVDEVLICYGLPNFTTDKNLAYLR